MESGLRWFIMHLLRQECCLLLRRCEPGRYAHLAVCSPG
jgi:hypothetical protein